jgi:hypothetical protein
MTILDGGAAMSDRDEMTVREFVDQHPAGYFRSIPLAGFDQWFEPNRFKSLLNTRMRTDRTTRSYRAKPLLIVEQGEVLALYDGRNLIVQWRTDAPPSHEVSSPWFSIRPR